MQSLPPELSENYCHIAPEWEKATEQKLWFVSAPYGGSVLRFSGEPTSLLYAIAPLISEIKEGKIPGLEMKDLALLNPPVSTEALYAELERRLRKQNLRIICISALTAGSAEARRIAALAKKVNPNTVTIFGGPHEDDIGLKTAVDPFFDGIVDFSVAGDGEYALLHLVKLIFNQNNAAVKEIKQSVLEQASAFHWYDGRGGIYFQYEGKSQNIPLNGKLPVLDKLPLMPRELLHEADTLTFSIFKKGGQNVKTAQIMTHRGCAWRCSFCSESATLNTRRAASVIEEIEEIKFFKERHPNLNRENYGAVFFDDSTFTTRSARRKEFLHELYAYLKNCGLEWGCQTRLDQIDQEILEAMKEAGCTYIYTGLESASNEMLRAMIKDERRKHIENAFQAINRVGIRVGVSLVFGVAELGFNKTPETCETITETLNFVEQQTHEGNIVMVSPNIATLYPSTRMTEASHSKIDFRHPIAHKGYPWNRFEEGEGYHPEGIIEETAEFIIKESIKKFGEYLVAQDVYSLEDYANAYRTGSLEKEGLAYADFNHSSICRPRSDARAAATAIAELSEINIQDRRNKLSQARLAAAALMGLPESRAENIVLARNTTEAASLAFWLTGLHKNWQKSHVLTTNAENLSIPRAFRFHMDHGNPDGRDLWSSYQDFGAERQKDYLIRKRPTGLEVEEIDVISNTADMEKTILRRITPNTGLVIFCHVIRDDGRVCDVKRLCTAIRDVVPEAYILVDGAQALGALPSIKVEEIGCDFYVAAPHKTLGSYPLGLLYMSDRAKANISHLPSQDPVERLRCVVMDGMFAPNLGVDPTIQTQMSLPEVVGFTTAVQSLINEGLINYDNCWRLDNYRRKLKESFMRGLLRRTRAQITSPVDQHHSNFILTFRFPDADNREIVESLWRNHLVFLSYIARSNVIRASFGPNNTKEQVEAALNAICHEVGLSQPISEKQQATGN
jgi:selenocysteine lyase/cysteine desulfurase/radical SAM superfamily enzyme YgiQ (UPF0313 family)